MATKSMRKKKDKGPNPQGRAGVPVSLHPLSFEEAVSGLGQVKMPTSKEEKKQPKPKSRKRDEA